MSHRIRLWAAAVGMLFTTTHVTAADIRSSYVPAKKGHSEPGAVMLGTVEEDDAEEPLLDYRKYLGKGEGRATLRTSSQDLGDIESDRVAPRLTEPDGYSVDRYSIDPGPQVQPACTPDCPEFWEHRSAVWGEFLFWRPRGADVAYASTVDGTLATSVPLGDRSVTAFAYDPGFRVGVAWACDRCSSLTSNYTWYSNNTVDRVGLPGGGGSFLAAETVHPNTVNVAADSLAAQAQYDFQLQMIDLNYKRLIVGGDDYALNYLIGVNYARIEQDFLATYAILGTTTVNTNVNFDGIGPRFGFEGERCFGCCGVLGYAKGGVTVLAGISSADFLQQDIFTGVQARSGLEDSRIVTVPDLEVGGGWRSKSGCFRITAGYYVAAWFNMLTTPEYLSTVRVTQNSFEHQVRTLTLDGLNVRAEYRF